jgi:hypothetical protein
MAIRRLWWGWETNRDIHLLRGTTSRDLTATGLSVVDENGDQPSADNYLLTSPNDRIVFSPQFKSTGPPGGDYENSAIGIRVNQRTGAVTAALSPSRIKNNFVMEIQGRNQDGSTSNIETIRVHVHNSVVDAWLTPEHLTVRPVGEPPPEFTSYRFALRVQFDTGVVGDLTLHHGVRWSSAGPSGPDANVDRFGEVQLEAADAPGVDIPITATLPASLSGGTTPPATVRVRDPWDSDPDPPRAKIVVGGAWPGTILPDRVPNVLVCGDGFRAADSDAFDAIVDKIVHHLKTDKVMRPYDLLSTSMNFWKVFKPADTLGISVRSEVYVYPEGGRTWAVVLPAVQRRPVSGKWSFTHLLYAAGLPVPADVGRADAAIRADWDAVLETVSWPANVAEMIGSWKFVGNRGFIDELDAFPGMSYGTPPAAASPDNTKLGLHDDRGGTRALKAFFRTLRAENGVTTEAGKPIGDIWFTKNFDLYDFDNTRLILLVSSLNGGRAGGGEYIAMSRGALGTQIAVEPVGGGRVAWRLDLKDRPDKITADRCRTAAHELGHAFGLGDEYVDFDGLFPYNEAYIDDSGNLQTEGNARDTSGRLNGSEIKWKWHRIRKAAVIDGDITAEDGTFRIPLVLGHGTQFAEGDQVLLRARPRGDPLRKGQKTLANSKVLRVVEALWEDAVVVEPVATIPFNDLKTEIQRDYKKGSILYIPTPAPDSVRSAAYPYAEMVAKNIQDSITSRNRPLTAVPCVRDDREVQKPDLTGVSLPGILCFKHKTQIVGLYSGGRQWACGIFHPTGLCVMRDHDDADTEFCAVCRYVIVDFVDPLRHFEIDRDYAEIYPQD